MAKKNKDFKSLLIHSHQPTIDELKNTFTGLSIDLFLARNRLEADLFLVSEKFDFILFAHDLEFAHEGIKIMEQIRHDGHGINQTTPWISLTAEVSHILDPSQEDFLKVQCSAMVPFPFNRSTFRDLLMPILEQVDQKRGEDLSDLVATLHPTTVTKAAKVLLLTSQQKIKDDLVLSCQKLGLKMLSFRNGFEAMKALENEVFDFLILDSKADEMGGLEVANIVCDPINHPEKGEIKKTPPLMAILMNDHPQEQLSLMTDAKISFYHRVYCEGPQVQLQNFNLLMSNLKRFLPGSK
jgi:CheY-like chemotaxis protein